MLGQPVKGLVIDDNDEGDDEDPDDAGDDETPLKTQSLLNLKSGR